MKRLILLLICIAVSLVEISAQGGTVAERKLTVSILGDSYSTFQGYVTPDSNAVWYPLVKGNDVKRVEDTWWHRLIKEMGWQLIKNNSYSGSTVCYRGYNNEDYRLRSFLNRSDDLGTPDIILVFGGTNDSWSGVPVGEIKYSDWKDSPLEDNGGRGELYSYSPALAKMLDFMTKSYSKAQIFFILNSELREDITAYTVMICNHYGVPVVRLHDIHKQLGHPSTKGMQAIAEQVKEAFLSSKASKCLSSGKCNKKTNLKQ